MGAQKIKTVLIDNEARALNRLKLLLEHFPQVEVAGMFEEAGEGLDFIKRHQPDLALVDVEMPGINGLELTSRVNAAGVATRVIFVTAYEQYAIDALRQQAFDYLVKPVSIQDLEAALHRFRLQVQTPLTPREREIVSLLGQGLESREIGEKLFISKHTVDTYRRKLLEKTGAKNTAELVFLFSKNGGV